MSSILGKDNLVLLQGDSITDAGWDRSNPESMGSGYAAIIARKLTESEPALNLRFLNRGISGHRAVDLLNRWQPDCLDLKPDVVSIMIGINDTWRRYDCNDATTAESYRESYHSLLEQTSATGAKIVMVEPFVLPHPPDRIAWREDLDPKLEAVRALAQEFDALLIPLDGLMAEACTREPPEYWAADGVHPTPEGHELIADIWIKAVLSA